MVKSTSILIVGIGIFVFSVNLAGLTYHEIFLSEDFTLARQLMEFANNPTVETIEQNIEGITMLGVLIFSYGGMALGILLLLIGGPKLLIERRKGEEFPKPKKPVNLIWQVIGSAFPGFDLLVLYKIQKLTHGSIVYAAQYFLVIWAYFSGIPDFEETVGIVIGIGYAAIVFFWSRNWNKQFSRGTGEVESQ